MEARRWFESKNWDDWKTLEESFQNEFGKDIVPDEAYQQASMLHQEYTKVFSAYLWRFKRWNS